MPTRRRWLWMLILSLPALAASGAAVAALVAHLTDGPNAEFWLPGKGSADNMSRAWVAALVYGLLAALGFSMSWSLSKHTPLPTTPEKDSDETT
ncbi:hypothetical protein ACIQRS_09405 [Streptomyces termitum]|uniref:Uncharacterized protein n=1 Tax=Streptomyces termitum TaxID=67368 RepID=A0A918SPS4_9ACTN|nr:hypothetical protein [Streptomyces termitum]GHA63285.1 hypothetical protein GCM10010305_00730 [Streptomyces termitum]